MKRIILLILILIILVFIVVFIKESFQKRNIEELRIGVIIPLTGSGSPEGNDFLNGLLLAKEKFNPNIVLFIEDSQNEGAKGVTAAKYLIDAKNVDILVSFASSVSIPLTAIADQYNKPLLATAVAQDGFTEMSKNTFRLFATAEKYARMAANFADKIGIKKISTLTIHDEYGESIRRNFEKNFSGEILHEEKFEVSETDFRTSLIKTSGSEAIYSVGYNIHWVNLFKQREELGKNMIFISNQNMVSKFVQSQVGNLLTNAYAVVPPSTLANDKTKDFVKEFKDKYGHEPDWVAPFGYDILLILDIIQKSNKKPIDALQEIKIEGLNGQISFDSKRESNIPLVIVKAENGIIQEVKE